MQHSASLPTFLFSDSTLMHEINHVETWKLADLTNQPLPPFSKCQLLKLPAHPCVQLDSPPKKSVYVLSYTSTRSRLDLAFLIFFRGGCFVKLYVCTHCRCWPLVHCELPVYPLAYFATGLTGKKRWMGVWGKIIWRFILCSRPNPLPDVYGKCFSPSSSIGFVYDFFSPHSKFLYSPMCLLFPVSLWEHH